MTFWFVHSVRVRRILTIPCETSLTRNRLTDIGHLEIMGLDTQTLLCKKMPSGDKFLQLLIMDKKAHKHGS